jgi:hypothetical protein
MAGTLTAANAVLTLWQTILFPTPQQIQQFAADDVTDTDEVRRIEAIMGVDGTLSFGFVFVPVAQSVMLQANSPSVAFFEAIDTQQQAAEDVYPLNGTLLLPAVSKKYVLTNGGLVGVKPTPDVKRTLQPQRFRITWQSIVPSPQ